MDLAGKRVTVVGGARSGLAAARLLATHGAHVFLSDSGEGTDELRQSLQEAGVACEFGGHTPRALKADFIAISPGVPSTTPIVVEALDLGLQVYSEIEIASWFCRGPIVAITGSNGKTTTTSLIAHVFTTAERPHVLAGNIGVPFSDHAADIDDETAAILEVSSFQLDHIDHFRPRVSVLLNITPDHLDRYEDSFELYARSKFRIFENQQQGDVLVYNHDDEPVRENALRAASENGFDALGISLEQELERGAFVRGDSMILRVPSNQSEPEEVLMQTSELALKGRHNLYNSLASAIAARAMEIRSDVVRESLSSFEGVPHRLELVREFSGVRYINDSKATNVNAVWYALESFDEQVVLIAGGRDKGNDYKPLKSLIRERVRGIIGMGESADKVIAELGSEANMAARAESMEEAVQYARMMAEPGDVILLSPACASFDMFKNYEDRGETFRRIVMSL
jgi:UDP-N-acetylmuramoylalanine--D-glutamate ligase